MKKLFSNKTLTLDFITLILLLMFPLLRSRDYELFMTVLSVIGTLTFFSNIIQVRFSYKSDLNFEDNFKVSLMIWAKMFILMSLLNIGVQDIYLNNALGNLSSLNIYSYHAIIGWELLVWMYRIAVFYIPLIAAANSVLYMFVVLISQGIKNKNIFKLINRITYFVKAKAQKVIKKILAFNNKIMNLIKTYKSTRMVDYLSMNSVLLTINKKAQVPPLFNL